MMCILKLIRFITNQLIIVTNVESCSIFVYITKPYYLFIFFNYIVFDKINSIFFSISETDNFKSSIHVCTILHFFSVLGLASMDIDPISNNLTAWICHLMYVFMFW